MHTLTFYLTERAPIPIVQEAGWASGPVGTGLEKRKSLASTGFRTNISSDLTLSLHRLRC